MRDVLHISEGDQYRLTTRTLGVVSRDGRRVTVEVPEGAVVEVVDAGPNPDPSSMVHVRWRNEIVAMFVQDVQERGEPIEWRRFAAG